MKIRNIIIVAFVSLFSAASAVGIYKYFESKEAVVVSETPTMQYAKFPHRAYIDKQNQPVDFTFAASQSTPVVVHVKTSFVGSNAQTQQNPLQDFFRDDFFRHFYDQRGQSPRRSMASGSGVIISSDGYIVTNNHVIEDGNEIEVVMSNKQSYSATLIGTDKDTDIALLKIDKAALPFIAFANSDSVNVGEWALAVGNPFNLASTVTAGIVSAKGRNINILQNNNGSGSNTAIESFIQTDAAVNPGNSGGALVNINGELIGINTAIATPTGTYAGYSFAVPSNLVNKVVEDIKEFGSVQRGYLGVNIRSLDSELAEELNLNTAEGVYIMGVIDGSAADEAGIKNEDVITQINGVPVKSSSELQEQVANYRPGDKVKVDYFRSGKLYTASVVLKNKFNNTTLIEDNKTYVLEGLGIEVEEISDKQMTQLGISNGLKIVDLDDGKLKNYTDIRKGFIITSVNENPVNNIEDFVNIIGNTRGTVMIEGIYPEKANSTYLYAFKN
ncbi:MAG: Do family serine endopeptidase [Bacteroidia bacterium]|nr:Do family serine endopeptidase [Bacteroidia bacterium]